MAISIVTDSRSALMFALFSLLSVIADPLNAQEVSHGGHAHIGWLPAEILERPVSQEKGIGKIHETVSTKSAQAQIFYDQGLAYLQSYVWIEAARSFHQALRSDSQLAMAYVGLSYAYSPMDFAAASDALAIAQSMSEHMSARERQRVHIRELQLQAMANSGSSEPFAAFKQSLDEALAEFPGDEQFLLLRGNAEEANPFGDGQGCVPSAIPFYEKVLASSAENFAANHFLTHCYENSGRSQDALKFARLYVRLAPEIPHAHHMYGHVLRRTGGMLDAIAQFKAADALELTYFKKNNFPPTVDWHHPHNLGLLASSYQFLGKMKQAEDLYRRAGSLTPHSDFDAFNRRDLSEFFLDRGRFADALTAARALTDSNFPLARSAGHSLAGSALLGLNKPAEAAHELELSEREAAVLPPSEGSAARLPIAMLRANLFMVQRSPEAPPLLQRIAKRINAENGPDAWIQGLYQLERINRVARQVGDWQVAAQFAQLMKGRAPEYAGAHYALALSAQHDGDAHGAETEFALAAKAWANADSNLSELRVVHEQGVRSVPRNSAGNMKDNAQGSPQP